MTPYIRLRLKPKEEDRAKAGHPWIFANEIQGSPKAVPAGTLVEVVSSTNAPIGRGVANPASKILVRLLTHGFTEEIDDEFIERRVLTALAAREDLKDKYATDGLRLLFGEADGLPGVIADAFGKTAVLSCFSAGMKPLLPAVVKALQKAGYKHIYEKSSGEICKKEGMPDFQGWLTEPGSFPVIFKEGSAKFRVQPESGQKTGFYLDFRLGRKWFKELSEGKKVLDAFCYTGSASVQAALGGASEVLALESSQTAIAEAEENAKLNGVEGKIHFRKEDSFQALKELRKENARFQGILLDPPPMARSAHDMPAARIAFKRLIAQALEVLDPGGFLIAANCSHHFPWVVLEGVAREATEDAGRSFRLLERTTQPEDHPISLSIPETEYLRMLVLTEI